MSQSLQLHCNSNIAAKYIIIKAQSKLLSKMKAASARTLMFMLVGCVSLTLADACIDNYFQLEESLLNRTTNLASLRQAFFPTNRQASVVINVTYHIVGSKASLKFRWVDSPVLQLIRTDLLYYLSLLTFNVETRQADIILDPLCYNFTESIIDDPFDICKAGFSKDTGYELLNDLTVNVSHA